MIDPIYHCGKNFHFLSPKVFLVVGQVFPIRNIPVFDCRNKVFGNKSRLFLFVNPHRSQRIPTDVVVSLVFRNIFRFGLQGPVGSGICQIQEKRAFLLGRFANILHGMFGYGICYIKVFLVFIRNGGIVFKQWAGVYPFFIVMIV
ncbi:hypothetical protein Barb7_02464 [Bacteroidales bacterium Barb7]|nr:hypothetical protein Barb7_02464 [Bacteroidales bacterium Barb7]